jgi:hypothetical protein
LPSRAASAAGKKERLARDVLYTSTVLLWERERTKNQPVPLTMGEVVQWGRLVFFLLVIWAFRLALAMGEVAQQSEASSHFLGQFRGTLFDPKAFWSMMAAGVVQ